MKFVVHPEIFKFFPSLKLAVVVARDVEADVGRARVEALWRQTWEEAAREASVHGNAQSHPRISPWREAMGAMGVSGRKYPSSVEALLRRTLKGGEPASISPLVDFYNAVSLRHFVPVGAFDLGGIGDLLELGLIREGATFRPLEDSGTEAVGFSPAISSGNSPAGDSSANPPTPCPLSPSSSGRSPRPSSWRRDGRRPTSSRCDSATPVELV